MNKVQAYTVMELIVVMILSAIVISIAYTSFDIISGQYRSFKKVNEEINSVLLLDNLFTRDFNDSDYIKTTYDGIDCVYKIKIVKYEFASNFILRRENQLTDTFKVTAQNLKYKYLDGQIINEGSFVNNLTFVQSNKNGERLFSYTKNYSAQFLMSAEELFTSN